MISPWAALLLTGAAIHAYAGVYFCLLYLRRRRLTVHVAYGASSLLQGLHDAAAAFAADAVRVDDALPWLTLQYVAIFGSGATFLVFLATLASRTVPRWALPAGLAACLAMAVVALSGLLFDPARPQPPRLFVLPWARSYVEPAFEPPGYGVSVALFLVALLAAVLLFRAIEERRTRLLIGLSTAPAFAAAVHDELARAVPFGTTYLQEPTAVAPLLAMSVLLILRFQETAGELRTSTQRLNESHDKLRAARAQRARQAQLAAFGELSAAIAHAVRNPLAVMKNATGTLVRRTLGPEDEATLLTILGEEVTRLERLAGDLMAYARPLSRRRAPVDLDAMVADLVAELRLQHPEAPVVVDVEQPLPAVPGDALLLRQALRHLLENAYLAVLDGGRVAVTSPPGASRDRATTAVVIEDDGPGMPDEIRAKALDPFFTTRAAGTGLGLAIVERVAREHGGALRLTRGDAGGVRARLELPLATEGPR